LRGADFLVALDLFEANPVLFLTGQAQAARCHCITGELPAIDHLRSCRQPGQVGLALAGSLHWPLVVWLGFLANS
jgi:hypothetical protein